MKSVDGECEQYSEAYMQRNGCSSKCRKPIQQVPPWYATECMLHGYRPISQCWLQCLYSAFHLHNETGNIWTHLLAALMFLSLCWKTDFVAIGAISLKDQLVLQAYLAGTVTCMTLSTVFHVFYSHSRPVYKLLARMDYAGITLLIMCSFLCIIYYAYYNSPFCRALYMGVSVLCASICVLISLLDGFSEPCYRTVRGVLFLCDGLSGLIPAAHWLVSEVIYGKQCFSKPTLKLFVLISLMSLAYLAGTLIYVFKIPEVFRPGAFDLWFNSHQIFHVMVVTGALLFYHSLMHLVYLRNSKPDYFYN